MPLGRILPAAGLGLAGVVLVVIGTFLPWVSSGGTLRNSYQVVGLLDRLDVFDHPLVRTLLIAWPVVGPLAVVPVVLAILRWWRAAGAAGVVVGALVVAVVSTVLILLGDSTVVGVRIATTGPFAALAGGICLLVAGAMLLWPARGTR